MKNLKLKGLDPIFDAKYTPINELTFNELFCCIMYLQKSWVIVEMPAALPLISKCCTFFGIEEVHSKQHLKKLYIIPNSILRIVTIVGFVGKYYTYLYSDT
jgi:hypothetical protein